MIFSRPERSPSTAVKVFEEIAPEKAIKYTASLIIASGSGLARPFDDLTKGQGMGPRAGWTILPVMRAAGSAAIIRE